MIMISVYAMLCTQVFALLILFANLLIACFQTFVLAQIHLCPIAGQLAPVQDVWLYPPISSWIEHRRPPELVLCEVDVPVCCHREGICPSNPRIPCKHGHGPVGRIEEDDRVIFEVPAVNEAIGIGFQTVRDAFLAMRDYRLGGQELAELAVVAETSGGDRIEIPGADCGEVERLAVCTERNTIRTERALRNGHAGSVGKRVDGLAPDDWEETVFWVYVGCTV